MFLCCIWYIYIYIYIYIYTCCCCYNDRQRKTNMSVSIFFGCCFCLVSNRSSSLSSSWSLVAGWFFFLVFQRMYTLVVAAAASYRVTVGTANQCRQSGCGISVYCRWYACCSLSVAVTCVGYLLSLQEACSDPSIKFLHRPLTANPEWDIN